MPELSHDLDQRPKKTRRTKMGEREFIGFDLDFTQPDLDFIAVFVCEGEVFTYAIQDPTMLDDFYCFVDQEYGSCSKHVGIFRYRQPSGRESDPLNEETSILHMDASQLGLRPGEWPFFVRTSETVRWRKSVAIAGNGGEILYVDYRNVLNFNSILRVMNT